MLAAPPVLCPPIAQSVPAVRQESMIEGSSPFSARDASAIPDSMVTDVLVIGGGNAGLCAAITARDCGARVLILESSPRAFRGGNSRHTRNLRCVHDAPTTVLTQAYREDEYLADLLRVTKGRTDEHLARLAIRASSELPNWLMS